MSSDDFKDWYAGKDHLAFFLPASSICKKMDVGKFLLSRVEHDFHQQRVLKLECRLREKELAEQMDIPKARELINESRKLLILHCFQMRLNSVRFQSKIAWYRKLDSMKGESKKRKRQFDEEHKFKDSDQ